jgi:hypothetical protein
VTHWHDAGYGTDPDGDATRRAEQGVVELPDGTKIAGVPEHALPEVRRELLPAYVRPVYEAPAEPLRYAPVLPEVVEGELLDPADPHALTRREYEWGIAVVCACGKWECVVTGASSADWARRDHERHRTLSG